jgi:hypothetical protein
MVLWIRRLVASTGLDGPQSGTYADHVAEQQSNIERMQGLHMNEDDDDDQGMSSETDSSESDSEDSDDDSEESSETSDESSDSDGPSSTASEDGSQLRYKPAHVSSIFESELYVTGHVFTGILTLNL